MGSYVIAETSNGSWVTSPAGKLRRMPSESENRSPPNPTFSLRQFLKQKPQKEKEKLTCIEKGDNFYWLRREPEEFTGKEVLFRSEFGS